MTDFIFQPGPDFTTVLAKSSRAQHWIENEGGQTLVANEQVDDAIKFFVSINFSVSVEETNDKKT